MARGVSPPDGLGERLPNRNRLGWWLFVVALGAAAVFVAHSFVGLLVLGVFGYYATRPICDRIRGVVDSRQLAATLTVLTVLLPVLLLLAFALLQLYEQVQQLFAGAGGETLVPGVAGLDAVPLSEDQRRQLLSTLSDPSSFLRRRSGSLLSNLETVLGVLGSVFGALFLLGLSATLSYVLLANDGEVSRSLVRLFGGRDSTAYAYAVAVDADLESVFFGNLLFAVLMSVVATVTYAVTNLVAPGDLQVPLVFVLGFLTGLASLVPVVVGKLVYVPVVASLALQAWQSGGRGLAFVGGVLVVYVVVLDVLPQSFVQPYLSGRRLDPVLLVFAYLLGPALFGWYGFFLMPILFVLLLEAFRIVLPELLRGEPVRPEATVAEGLGTDPAEELGADEGLPVEETGEEDADANADANRGADADAGRE